MAEDMEMIIYHGSEKIVKNPQFGLGSVRNDYGRGFYCTQSPELAKEWACKNGRDGFMNKYRLNMEGLRVLNLNSPDYHILNWLALLTRYRGYWQRQSIAEEAKDYLQEHFLIDISKFDLIIGYRADDSYFSFAQDFIAGTISLQKLEQAMKLGKLGEQVVLKSQQAFGQLSFMGCERADAEEYSIRKARRDLEARRGYHAYKSAMSVKDEVYMIDIMRGNLNGKDLRL